MTVTQVEAANRSYYDALSARDLDAMARLWTGSSEDVNIAPPVRPAVHVGWPAIQENYRRYWGTLEVLDVVMEAPVIRVAGPVAWVHGVEKVHRVGRDHQAFRGTNYGTSIFVLQDDRWRLTFHQAAPFVER